MLFNTESKDMKGQGERKGYLQPGKGEKVQEKIALEPVKKM